VTIHNVIYGLTCDIALADTPTGFIEGPTTVTGSHGALMNINNVRGAVDSTALTIFTGSNSASIDVIGSFVSDICSMGALEILSARSGCIMTADNVTIKNVYTEFSFAAIFRIATAEDLGGFPGNFNANDLVIDNIYN